MMSIKYYQLNQTLSTTDDLPSLDSDQNQIVDWHQKGEQMLKARKIAYLPGKFDHDKMAAIQVSLDAISEFAGADVAVLNSGLFLNISSESFNGS